MTADIKNILLENIHSLVKISFKDNVVTERFKRSGEKKLPEKLEFVFHVTHQLITAPALSVTNILRPAKCSRLILVFPRHLVVTEFYIICMDFFRSDLLVKIKKFYIRSNVDLHQLLYIFLNRTRKRQTVR